jgi:hypothetical protein
MLMTVLSVVKIYPQLATRSAKHGMESPGVRAHHKEYTRNLMLYDLVCPAKYRKEVFTEAVVHTL